MYGSDQAASLELPGLVSLLGSLRKIATCVGSNFKQVSHAEEEIAKKLRYW
jgi:sialic acid synthase SpsE